MGVIGHVAVYFVIWWTTLFAVLPFGVRSQAEDNQPLAGTDPGAPIKPRLLQKFLINTIIAALIWGIYFAIYQFDLLSFRR